MFPRIVKSDKKSGLYEYLVISESVRKKGKGSTTANIANLGNIAKFDKRSVKNLINGLIRLFKVDGYAAADGVEIIEATTFVGDRGMITKLNLSVIEGEEFDHIMAVRARQSDIVSALLEGGGLFGKRAMEWKGLTINDIRTDAKTVAARLAAIVLRDAGVPVPDRKLSAARTVDEVGGVVAGLEGVPTSAKRRIHAIIKRHKPFDGKVMRFVACLNKERKKIEERKRSERIATISSGLEDVFSSPKAQAGSRETTEKIARLFEGHRRQYRKFFIFSDDQSKPFRMDEKELAEAARLDGVFVLSTSRGDELPAEKVVESYKNLKEVEELFNDMKNFVDIHPVRHWLEKRVRAHVFLCVLALLLKRVFQNECLRSDAVTEPLEEVARMKVTRYRMTDVATGAKSAPFLAPTTPTEEQRRVFEAAGIRNPTSMEEFVW